MGIPIVIEAVGDAQSCPADTSSLERQVSDALDTLANDCPHSQLVLCADMQSWFGQLCAQTAAQKGILVIGRREQDVPAEAGDVLRADDGLRLHARLSFDKGKARLTTDGDVSLTRTDTFNADCQELLAEGEGEGLPNLQDIYEAADQLSMRHQKRYLTAMFTLSLCCVGLVLAFLLYDEAELRLMLAAYGIIMVFYALQYRRVMRSGYHMRYIQYRVLAETLRVQGHLASLGITANAADDFPWTQRADVAWVRSAVEALICCGGGVPSASEDEVKSDWIDGQAAYHRRAATRDGSKTQASDTVVQAMLVTTVLLFLLTSVLEFVFTKVMAVDLVGISVCSWLKIALGCASAVTLFVSGYYGSLSLERKVHDHERMAILFERAASAYEQHPDARRELFRQLAREEIIENGTWMSYCTEDRPSFSL